MGGSSLPSCGWQERASAYARCKLRIERDRSIVLQAKTTIAHTLLLLLVFFSGGLAVGVYLPFGKSTSIVVSNADGEKYRIYQTGSPLGTKEGFLNGDNGITHWYLTSWGAQHPKIELNLIDNSDDGIPDIVSYATIGWGNSNTGADLTLVDSNSDGELDACVIILMEGAGLVNSIYRDINLDGILDAFVHSKSGDQFLLIDQTWRKVRSEIATNNRYTVEKDGAVVETIFRDGKWVIAPD